MPENLPSLRLKERDKKSCSLDGCLGSWMQPLLWRRRVNLDLQKTERTKQMKAYKMLVFCGVCVSVILLSGCAQASQAPSTEAPSTPVDEIVVDRQQAAQTALGHASLWG